MRISPAIRFVKLIIFVRQIIGIHLLITFYVPLAFNKFWTDFDRSNEIAVPKFRYFLPGVE